MSKIMLVNVTHVEESRVAVLDNGVLDAYEIETINRAHIKGNIYNAVVESTHPGLEASFLRISADLKGFLPLDEVNFKLLPARGEGRKGSGRIGQHLSPGQKIMAQVVREPFAGKPPTVSTYFSLPGRYLVLMPGVDSAGVSRKIEDSSQRERLKKIVEELCPPEGFGLIVRTAGMGQTKLELQRDLRYLLRLWQSIQRASQATEFPGLVYREADLVIRTIRDHFSPDIKEVWVDSKETYDRAMKFFHDLMPTRAKTLRLYTADRPLFNKYNLEEQIETIYKRRVPLPSGGDIVIDGTEALTAVDVNSARSRSHADAEENATQTNLEAAKEIARQLRLRDLGGLIVIDFIDMYNTRNKKKVEKAMRDAMRGDKAKYDVTGISKLGLLEISRQRIKGAKMGDMYTSCPTCEGYGLVKNVESAALAAVRKLQTRVARADFGRIRLSLPPEVANWILNHKREELFQLERRHNVRIDIDPRPKMMRHESELETLAREKVEEPIARSVGDRVVALPPSEQELERAQLATGDEPTTAKPEGGSAEPAAAAPEESTAPRKRRRRRRRGASQSAPAAGSPEPPAEPAKVVPFVAPEVPEADAAPDRPQGEETAEPSGQRRRRRRRRKRSRQGGAAAGDEASDPGAERSQPREPEEENVPKGVRFDELMPAAAGTRASRGGQRGPRKSGSQGRARRSPSETRGRRGAPPRPGEGDED